MIIKKIQKIGQLHPLLRLCVWSLAICVLSLVILLFMKVEESLKQRDIIKMEADIEEKKQDEEAEDEPFKGNNLNTYIELLQMPPEIVFENIRVMITNKQDNSIFYDRDNFDEVYKAIETAGYRGEIIYQEAVDDSDKFVIINELPLEQYLYGVVPSEMPSSYPAEALKAQAICARTYAVLHMMNPAYPAYDAHVNDTISFQVYHNIDEQETTNQAVKETAGQLLFQENGEELIETYYYSTSCGEVCEASTNIEFKEYISQTNNDDFEVGESWYRWSCNTSSIDKADMLAHMQDRYKANKANVLTMTGQDLFESLPVKELDTIRELFISKRGEGGVGEELIIKTDKNIYKIIGEYNIRYILNDPNTEINKQDGNTVKMATLLPSAFISLEAIKDNDIVTGYQIMGGGYGHGNGMSQNGAKSMALQGYTTEEILSYYYPGCQILDNL